MGSFRQIKKEKNSEKNNNILILSPLMRRVYYLKRSLVESDLAQRMATKPRKELLLPQQQLHFPSSYKVHTDKLALPSASPSNVLKKVKQALLYAAPI